VKIINSKSLRHKRPEVARDSRFYHVAEDYKQTSGTYFTTAPAQVSLNFFSGFPLRLFRKLSYVPAQANEAVFGSDQII
jgi:hypothetical protein